MLESLHLTHGPAFGPGIAIGPLRPVTIFFGANGSGKTTISRSLSDTTAHGGTTLTWSPSTSECSIKVYNRDYADKTLLQANLPGVFLLGQVSAEIQGEIDELSGPVGSIARTKKLLDGRSELLTSTQTDIRELHENFRNSVWKAKATVPQGLSRMFAKFNASRERLLARVLEVAEAHADASDTFEQLVDEAIGVFDSDISPAELLPRHTSGLLEDMPGVTLLDTPIVGSSDVRIAPLIDRMRNADWIRHGQNYLEHTDGRCPFCQQAIPQDLVALFDRYFDERYSEQIEQIESLQIQIGTWATAWRSYVTSITEHPSAVAHLNSNRFDAARQRLERRIDSIANTVAEKVGAPSSVSKLATPVEEQQAVLDLVDATNFKINAYNVRLRDFERVQADIIARCWRTFTRVTIVAHLAEYEARMPGLRRTESGLQDAIEMTNETLRTKQQRLRELQAKVTSSKPIIDRINQLLGAVGFHSFRLEQSRHIADGYTIRRESGEVAADTLSEGERTFITFLYFAQSLEGAPQSNDETNDLLAVIDDPISSLDSDVLYAVSTLVRRIIADVGANTGRVRQLILLTHNAHFHKEVAYQSPKQPRVSRTFGIVRKRGRNPSIIDYYAHNPIQTAYAALWDEVKRAADDPYTTSVGLQNVLRRILETYFTILGDINTEDIVAKFTGPDQITCRALFSWVNAGSHSIFDDLHVSPTTVTVEANLLVFETIFKNQNQHGHYLMMMGIIDQPSELPQRNGELAPTK